jgi:hypothetical protein
MFSALFAALPGLKAALLRPLEPAVALEYPDWAMRSLALLESGVRWEPMPTGCVIIGAGSETDYHPGEPPAHCPAHLVMVSRHELNKLIQYCVLFAINTCIAAMKGLHGMTALLAFVTEWSFSSRVM